MLKNKDRNLPYPWLGKGGYNFSDFSRWWFLMLIYLELITLKKKKLMLYIYIYIPTVIGATIPVVRSPILAIRWSKTSIQWQSSEPLLQYLAHRWWQYDGWRHQSVSGHQSHYFGSVGIGSIRRSNYFNNLPTSQSLFGDTVGGKTNLVVFVRATIWRFDHWTSTTGGSIGQATGVSSLLKMYV